MKPKIDIMVGEKFTRLTVVTELRPARPGRQILCKCECGATKIATPSHLHRGLVKSCGCLGRETTQFKAVHGEGANRTAEYLIWGGMRSRCLNPRNRQYASYGGRGIRVCERWSDYASFLADMGRRPSSRHSLDRIDVNGDYSPENCRWASARVQANNRRNTVIVKARGQFMTCADAARLLGITYQKARYRHKHGIPLDHDARYGLPERVS